jgi:hypothetical protein
VTLQSDLLARSLGDGRGRRWRKQLPAALLIASTLGSRSTSAIRAIAQELVTVRKSLLGNARGSIAGERDAVIASLDLLFTGF